MQLSDRKIWEPKKGTLRIKKKLFMNILSMFLELKFHIAVNFPKINRPSFVIIIIEWNYHIIYNKGRVYNNIVQNILFFGTVYCSTKKIRIIFFIERYDVL